ncbi:alcohol dehydrogenase 2 [Polytolypa hystricis UAMH7299]|uniref:Alcohol dehydrogenase 2 n=1 Tax=Polytolypa hystricis (strain UAMH7299) TaxID=1447883 RepID=A0A2B7Z2J3_POLH7|nr:alcohol dehydrogenase 2 [Polytolypa hystricis UAMH7299]
MAAVEVPKQAKAAVYDNPGTISTKVVDVDVPEPGPGEVLVNLTHTGVCHSDLGIMTNSWKGLPYPTQPGQVGGHEGVGKVVKLGAGAESSGVKIGDRVGIKWISSVCGNCAPCQDGSDGCCSSSKVSGYYTPGTFQQYAVGPAHYVTPIPDGVPSEEAAPLLCAGVTVYSALKRSHAQPGQWVVISGAGGGLGHIACQLSSRGLGHRVIGIDHGSKADIIKESGAEHFVDITQFPADDKGAAIAKHVLGLTGGGLGAHAVIVCTASNAAYAQAISFLRVNGVLVCVGMPEGDPVPVAAAIPALMVSKQLTITGSAVGNRKEAIETMEFAARGVIKSHVRVEKMDKLTAVFEEMEKGALKGRVVLDLS